MASTFLTTPSSPVLHSDIRAAAQPFKRDKDHGFKWLEGTRPSAGVRPGGSNIPGLPDVDDFVGGSLSQREKVRPEKRLSQTVLIPKPRANKTPKPSGHTQDGGWSANRIHRKNEALLEANSAKYSTSSDISQSLLDLVPRYAQNASPSIHTAIRTFVDEGSLLSAGNVVASPTKKGRAVGLGDLVEKAEEKFLDKQTERMVKEDYDVLDVEGESVTLKTEKKRKGSPKQKAAVIEPEPVVEDDGFELI